MAPRRSFSILRRIVGARHVFGKPVERNGVTVVPVASVIGGGGAGEGTSPASGSKPAGSDDASDASRSEGSGIGFGLMARPVGAFELRDDGVRWKPAFDLTRLLTVSIVAGLLVTRWVLAGHRRSG
jgi:uncharacterized spore protein YtfJ